MKVVTRKKRGVISPNESSTQCQKSVASSFAGKMEILRRLETSKEKLRELSLVRVKETDWTDDGDAVQRHH